MGSRNDSDMSDLTRSDVLSERFAEYQKDLLKMGYQPCDRLQEGVRVRSSTGKIHQVYASDDYPGQFTLRSK